MTVHPADTFFGDWVTVMHDVSNEFIENKTFDELTVSDTASLSHTITQRNIDLFATITGDVGPAHVDRALNGPSASVASSE